jgi:hypothetical protein
MTPDALARIEISRADFTRVLKTVARGMSNQETVAGIRFEGSWLHIESSNVAVEAPASGVWPEKIFVSVSWVRRLATRMPAGDPIHISLSDGRIHVNRYSASCAAPPPEELPETSSPQINAPALIAEAAKILKPLRVSPADLNRLVEEARARGPVPWRTEEKKMISLIARAWEKLARLGVETADLRQLVDKSVRNAWK